MHPEIFTCPKLFDKAFDISKSKSYGVNKDLLLKVHDMLKPFMLRRIKANVEKNLPLKIEKKILCPLTPLQIFWYKRFLLKENSLLEKLELEHYSQNSNSNLKNKKNTNKNISISTTSTDTKYISIKSDDNDNNEENEEATTAITNKNTWKKFHMLYMQLRKVSNHPFLFDECNTMTEGIIDESIIEASGKLQVLDKLLEKLQLSGHRVVIFSQFTKVLDIIGDYLTYRNYNYYRLDGSTNRVLRQAYINKFNAKNSNVFAFIMSTRAGGLGVNLQTADTVILYDSDWNPQVNNIYVNIYLYIYLICMNNIVCILTYISSICTYIFI